MSPYPPGSFFLRQITGWQGRLIGAAQAFVRGGSQWTHAGIVGHDEIIQAEPGGAKVYPLQKLFDGRPTLVSDAPIRIRLSQGGEVNTLSEAALREAVVAEAHRLLGTPYSFIDYPVLALAEWTRVHPHNPITANLTDCLRKRVQTSGHMICSALVDAVYVNCGIHLFDDGRLPGDVTPGDLDLYASEWQADIVRRAMERGAKILGEK